MAKNDTKNSEATEAPEADAQAEATTEPTTDEVTAEISAVEQLAQAKVDFDKLQTDLKAKIKSENKTVAVDLVTEVSTTIVPDLVFAVGRRGQRLNSFTIRYNGKAEANEQVKIVTAAVRMSAAEYEAFKVANAAKITLAEAAEAGEESSEAAEAGGSDSD